MPDILGSSIRFMHPIWTNSQSSVQFWEACTGKSSIVTLMDTASKKKTARLRGTLSTLNVLKLFPFVSSMSYFIFGTNSKYGIVVNIALLYLQLFVSLLLLNISDLFETIKWFKAYIRLVCFCY